MKNSSNSIVRFAVAFIATTGALLAGPPSVVPEPSLVALTAVGIGAIVLIARKKRGR